MKSILFAFLLLGGFHVLFGQEGGRELSKTFYCQIYNVRNTLSITYSGEKIIAHRSSEHIPSDISESSIFMECDVRIFPFYDGSLQVTALDSNTWFIPINLGRNPIKLNSGDCIRMFCIHFSGCPDLEIINLSDRITASGNIDAQCSKKFNCVLTHTQCDSIIPYDFFNGGVIVKAKSIEISDPESFKPGTNSPILFQIDDKGNMIGPIKKEKKD